MSDKAKRFIKEIFLVYVNNTSMLPQERRDKITKKKMDKHVVVCDYIAGMTDRYALDDHKKLFDPYEKV